MMLYMITMLFAVVIVTVVFLLVVFALFSWSLFLFARGLKTMVQPPQPPLVRQPAPASNYLAFASPGAVTVRMQAASSASAPQATHASIEPVPVNAFDPPPPPRPAEPPADNTPSILCPVCHTATHRLATECDACGLIFLSRVPATLYDLPDYRVLRPLGGGGMSTVYLARRKRSDMLCVIKTLATVDNIDDPKWRAEAARCLREEYNLLWQLDHPHIARVLYWVSTKHNEFMVLEYIPGLTLEQCLTRSDGQGGILPGGALPVPEALNYGITVARILEYLSRLSVPVVHHDIKPANLIVRPDDNRLMLVDFGSAVLLPRDAGDHVRLDCYGTPGYAAPEQYNGQCSPRSDIYSLGATLYHLLTDDDPTVHPLAFPDLAKLPPRVAQVLAGALHTEPTERPDARLFVRQLQRLLG